MFQQKCRCAIATRGFPHHASANIPSFSERCCHVRFPQLEWSFSSVWVTIVGVKTFAFRKLLSKPFQKIFRRLEDVKEKNLSLAWLWGENSHLACEGGPRSGVLEHGIDTVI